MKLYELAWRHERRGGWWRWENDHWTLRGFFIKQSPLICYAHTTNTHAQAEKMLRKLDVSRCFSVIDFIKLSTESSCIAEPIDDERLRCGPFSSILWLHTFQKKSFHLNPLRRDQDLQYLFPVWVIAKHHKLLSWFQFIIWARSLQLEAWWENWDSS